MRKAAELLREYLRSLPRGSLAHAAKAARMPPPVIYRLVSEDADTDPRLSTLDQIAAALNTTPADLLGGVTPPPETEALLETIKRQQQHIRDLESEVKVLKNAVGAIPGDLLVRLISLGSGHRVWDLISDAVAGTERAEGRADPSLRKPRKAD